MVGGSGAPRGEPGDQSLRGGAKNLHFIDLWDAMLTADGQPREDIWVEDRVHLNHAGYRLRVGIMRPLFGRTGCASDWRGPRITLIESPIQTFHGWTGISTDSERETRRGKDAKF